MSNTNSKPSDVIVVDKEGDQWISIKDASDLLGCSERHIWRLISRYRWESKKEKSANKQKAFVLRQAVEKFSQEERSRSPLHKLNPGLSDHDNADTSAQKPFSALSDHAKSDVTMPMETLRSFPVLLKEYQASIAQLHKEKETFSRSVVFWKTSVFWLTGLSVLTCALLLFYLSDKSKVLAQKEKALSDSYASVSLLNNTVGTLSDKVAQMSGQLKSVSDKFDVTQQDLDAAQAILKKRGVSFEKTPLEPVSRDTSKSKP